MDKKLFYSIMRMAVTAVTVAVYCYSTYLSHEIAFVRRDSPQDAMYQALSVSVIHALALAALVWLFKRYVIVPLEDSLVDRLEDGWSLYGGGELMDEYSDSPLDVTSALKIQLDTMEAEIIDMVSKEMFEEAVAMRREADTLKKIIQKNDAKQ